MERRYERIGGIGITVEDHGGDGPAVVFVHGLGGSAGNWSLLAPRLTDTAHAVALDLPGHGRSAPAPTNDLDAHVSAVVGLLELLDEGPVTLVGNSMGGLVSEMVTAGRPDLVAALVLLSPATPPVELAPVDRAVAVRLALQSMPVVGPVLTDRLTARTTPQEQVRETLRIVMADPSVLPDEVAERAVALAALRRTMPWAARAFSESMGSIRRHLTRRSAWRAMILSIDVPTTLIFGSEDRVVPPSALRRLATLRGDWRTIELAGVGHTPMLERPDIVALEIARRIPIAA